MAHGFWCMHRLDRSQAPMLVQVLSNQAEYPGAADACRQALQRDPLNAQAYFHMIELCGRRLHDFVRAEKYWRLGLAALPDPADRERLTALYTYTLTVHRYLRLRPRRLRFHHY
jgi:hypothetical protein